MRAWQAAWGPTGGGESKLVGENRKGMRVCNLLLRGALKFEIVARAKLRIGGKIEAGEQIVNAREGGCDARVLEAPARCSSEVRSLGNRVRETLA